MPPILKMQATIVLAALAGALAMPPAHAAYPDKPVKILVGSPPASPSDITSRLLAERLAERWK
jgi:tripartite-type tricarboxylate transporter receptor subunit TctC